MIECWCYECLKNIPVSNDWSFLNVTMADTHLILCPTCGNKRCPRATDHRLACTNSNESGQEGSRYGIYPHPLKPLFDFLDKKDD